MEEPVDIVMDKEDGSQEPVKLFSIHQLSIDVMTSDGVMRKFSVSSRRECTHGVERTDLKIPIPLREGLMKLCVLPYTRR